MTGINATSSLRITGCRKFSVTNGPLGQQGRVLLVHLRRLSAVVALACLNPTAIAQESDQVSPTIHWAYASFFGTGWYKINDQRNGFAVRAPLRWTFGEAGFDESGDRQIAYTLRLPFTVGLARLDFEDVPGVLDPDNLVTASANISLDADIPITKRFHVRPVAEVGYSKVLDDSDRAWTYRAEVKTRTKFEYGKLDWALLFDYGIVGYEPNQGDADDFEFAAVGLEFGYPVNWLSSLEGQTMLHWSLVYTDFIDEIEVRTGIEEFDSVANFWQASISLGKRDKPVQLWRLSFDRLGLAYNFSTTGELRGVKFVFRSLYEL